MNFSREQWAKASAHPQTCNIWSTSQQCDGPDLTMHCTCGRGQDWLGVTRDDIKPLGMSDDAFLRSMNINPEDGE